MPYVRLSLQLTHQPNLSMISVTQPMQEKAHDGATRHESRRPRPGVKGHDLRGTRSLPSQRAKEYPPARSSSRGGSWLSPPPVSQAGTVTLKPHSRMPSMNSGLSKSSPAASAPDSTADQFDCAFHSAEQDLRRVQHSAVGSLHVSSAHPGFSCFYAKPQPAALVDDPRAGLHSGLVQEGGFQERVRLPAPVLKSQPGRGEVIRRFGQGLVGLGSWQLPQSCDCHVIAGPTGQCSGQRGAKEHDGKRNPLRLNVSAGPQHDRRASRSHRQVRVSHLGDG